MRVLCVFGRNQYGDPSRGHSTEYVAFVPALERLGHRVDFFDSWDTRPFVSLEELNVALRRTADEVRPDIVLFVPYLYEVWLETLDSIRAGGAAVMCWTTDDSWKYKQSSRYFARHVDAIATTYSHVLPQYRRDGMTHVMLTQWAAPSASLSEPLPANECNYSLSFVGTATSDRRRRVSALRARGFAVECFGHGWPAGAVAAEAIPEIIRSSIISLNFATSYGENQIKARTFEVPGAGGFLLTDPARDLERFYVPGKEIEIFRNSDELVEKIVYYLGHPEERDRIARAGHARTKLEHTYERRLEKLVEFAVEAAGQRAAPGRGKADEAFAEAVRRHRRTPLLIALRSLLVGLGTLALGRERGPRAARRLVYEMSWRIAGEGTFCGAGLPGRMFPDR
ncbi:MAG TPA: glycosyltransferase [Thermoanaerobaculia bacterium]|nr:glycosyltransferase [Thermoanaerobaculia bacterium]